MRDESGDLTEQAARARLRGDCTTSYGSELVIRLQYLSGSPAVYCRCCWIVRGWRRAIDHWSAQTCLNCVQRFQTLSLGLDFALAKYSCTRCPYTRSNPYVKTENSCRKPTNIPLPYTRIARIKGYPLARIKGYPSTLIFALS